MFYGTPWADKNKSEAIDLQNCSTAVFDHLLTNEFSRSKNRWNSREEYSFMNRSTLLNIVHSTQCAQLDYFSTTKIRDDNTDGDVVDEHRTRPDLYCSTPCSEGNTSIQDWLSNLVYESAASTYGEQTTKDNDSSLSSVVPSESIFDSFESFGKPDYLQVNTTDDQKPDLCWNYYHSCTKEISPQGNSFSIANSNLVSHPYSEFSSNYESVHSHLRSGGPMCSQQEVIRSICDATISSMAVHSSSIKYTVDQEQNAVAHQTSEHQRPTENLPSTVRTVASQQQQQPVTSFIPNDHIFGGFTCSNQAAVSCSSSYTNEWNHLDAEFTEHTGDSNLDSCVSSGRRNPLDYRTSSHYNSPSCSEQMKHDTRQYPINAGAFNLLDSPFACHAPQNPTRAVMKRKLDDNHIGVQFKYGVANATTGFTVCGFGTPNRTTDNCQNNIDSEIHTPLSNFTIENCMTSTNSDHSSDQLATYNPALRGAFNFSVSTNTYFWQYNSQCKGPKAIRLFKLDGSPVRSENNSDEPDSTVGLWMGLDLYESSASASGSMVGEVTSSFQKSYTHSTLSLPDYPLIVFEDPVQRRYDLVHCSKLRRGDGNDVTPNLARLRAMGEELDKLSQLLIKHGEVIMAGTTKNTSLTSMVLGQQSTDNKCDHLSPEHRLIEQAKREKNKLASKICRLKKKAFHEANKIKYTGLGLEYDELATIIIHIRKMICDHLRLGISSKITEGNIDHFSSEHHDLQPRQSGTYGLQTCTEQDRYDTNGVSVGSVFETSGHTFERPTSSLLTCAIQTYEKINVTHAASRLDPLVDEVLRHFRAGHLSHPLVRGMTMDVLGTLETINDKPQNSTIKSSIFGVDAPVCLNDYQESTTTEARRCPINEYVHYTQTVQPPPKFTVTYHPDCVTNQPNQFY